MASLVALDYTTIRLWACSTCVGGYAASSTDAGSPMVMLVWSKPGSKCQNAGGTRSPGVSKPLHGILTQSA